MALDPAVTSAITHQGQVSGLSVDQIQAALAVATAEGGGVGDGGTSFGPFQFHVGGQLDSFLTWLQSHGYSSVSSLFVAGNIAITHPDLASQYALRPGGYLYTALRNGSAAGKSGADLAAYAQQFGQKSAAGTYQAAADAWYQLFGAGGGPPINAAPNPGAIDKAVSGLQPIVQGAIQAVSGGSALDLSGSINALGQTIAKVPNALTAPFVDFINNLQALGAFLGQPNLTKRALLLAGGVVVSIAGLILFSLSFVPKSAVATVAKAV